MNRHRINRTLSAGLLLAAVLTGCRQVPSGLDIDRFTRTVYSPQYASGFEILGTDDGESTLIRVTDPWQGAEGVSHMLLIDRDGDGGTAGRPDIQRIEGQAARIVCMSSSYVAMLSALDCTERVAGVSGIDFISDSRIAARRDKVVDVGFEPDVDYERLVALRPDLVLLYGVTARSAMETKLRELGIPYLYMGEYIEQSPLGKAEWMVAVAEIAGCREKGEQTFAAIAERYEALRSVAARAGSRPKVMINAPYGDNWFMPSTESYMARLITDAGGDYAYGRNTSNVSQVIDMEEAFRLASEADCWINIGQFANAAELRGRYPKFAGAKCVRDGRIYNCNRRLTPAGGNDFWESGVVKPDVILHDLTAIFHPELALSSAERFDTEMYYYRRLE